MSGTCAATVRPGALSRSDLPNLSLALSRRVKTMMGANRTEHMAAAIDLYAYQEPILFLATAGIVVPLFHRLRISPVLGFLGAGALLGSLRTRTADGRLRVRSTG